MKYSYLNIDILFRLIVAGSCKGRVKIWCRESSECLATIQHKVKRLNFCIPDSYFYISQVSPFVIKHLVIEEGYFYDSN